MLYPDRDAAGVRDDGLLTIGEIQDLPLRECRLAVLSACQTNLGAEIRGEMALSISRAFLVAGAHRVVASQWPVGDQAAYEHLGSFLAEVARRWIEKDPCDYAAAMSIARHKLRKRHPDDPFYWAPFILIGPARDVTR